MLPNYDHRYRAVFFPGADLARELSQRYRAATGRPLIYVIGSMWDGGNVAHYAPDHPRVLIDGKPARAPWIDLADLRSKGAVVVWTDGDLNAVPPGLRSVAGDAAVQPPFVLHDRRGELQHQCRLGHSLSPAIICGQVTALIWCCSSPTIRPSSSSMWRSMRSARPRSCVTATTVLPCLCDNIAQNLEDLFAGLGIERAGRLVRENDRRFVGKRARHRNALALPARQLVRPLVHVIAKAEQAKQLARRVLA